jgi:radical SAM superfamily enzyme YgiQ (UPF0313 family)
MINITCLAIHSVDNYPGMPKWRFSLSFAYLQAYATKSPLYPLMKFTPLNFYENNDFPNIINHVVESNPDVLAISCYVWNFNTIQKVIPIIKEKLPLVKIVLGGPQFSEDSTKIIKENKLVDYVVIGEGEVTFTELLEYLINKSEVGAEHIDGLMYFDKNKKEAVITNKREVIQDLDEIPSPFTLKIIDDEFSEGLVAIETQRGCIQNCAYCNYQKGFKKLRYFSIERVVADLKKIMEKKPKQIYLMDPSFNSNQKRAKTILSTIIEHCKDVKHKPFINAEMIPDLLDEELIKLSKDSGMTILEAGIQSLNPKALTTMGRMRIENKLFENIGLALKYNLQVVPQIIFGLPGDNINSFFSTFDQIYNLKTEHLDVFHLLILPMTRYRNDADIYGIEYEAEPPYKIIRNNDFSKEEISRLAGFTKLVLASLPMKFVICDLCEEKDCKPHETFLKFNKLNKKIDEFKWPIQTEEDKNKVVKMLDELHEFLCNQYLLDLSEEKQEEFKQRLSKSKRESQFLLIGHFMGVKKVKETKSE